MADYYHLNVYKVSYKLLVAVCHDTKNLNKEHKYTIGEKIKERAFEILLNIYRANKNKDKVKFIENALDDTEYIRLSIRLLRDLNVLNESKFANINEIIEDVSTQFLKWGECSRFRVSIG
jgi:four helix bundle protein